MRLDSVFRDIGEKYLGRALRDSDGLREDIIEAAEHSLGFRMPLALREYYRLLGGVEVLNRGHNRVLAPAELTCQGPYLIFMDENQHVVSWGIQVGDCKLPDPPVWQRNNAPPLQWFREDKSVTELLDSMFAWYREIGVL